MISIEDIVSKLERFGITNRLEQVHFLAQADHESAGFTKLTEGSKYRFARAKIIWKSRANIIQAKQDELHAKDDDFCPQPWLFNTVYGSRMGNESNGIEDDDGYDNRGMGIFQLTGYDNRIKFLDDAHHRGFLQAIDINNINDWLCTEDGAIYSAIWYWVYNNIGIHAQKDDINAVTKLINGGVTGLNERLVLLKKYKTKLGI